MMEYVASTIAEIGCDEYAGRVAKVRRLMGDAAMAAIIVGTGPNLAYFSGYPSPRTGGSRPFYLVIPAVGEPVLIVHRGRRAEAIRYGNIRDVRDYSKLSVAPVGLLEDALRECGALGGTIGMEFGYEQRLDMPYLEFLRLTRHLSSTTFEDASSILWRMRMIKSPAEVACIRRACAILSEAYELAFANLCEGMTEREASNLIRNHIYRSGATESFIFITSGFGNYELTSKTARDRLIKKGDLVWIDSGCTVAGYHADFSRAAVVGPASCDQLEAQAEVVTITQDVVRMVRPGIKVSELALACESQLSRLKFSVTASISGLASRSGHGIGLDATEPPDISEYDDTVLQPGMVIAIEPGVSTVNGTFHVEENVLVTDTGYELLSNTDKRLWLV